MKHVVTAADLKEFVSARRLMVVHAEDGWIEPMRRDAFDFFTKLSPKLEEEGVAAALVTLGTGLSSALLEQNHIHLILGDAPLYAPGVLHVAPAYIWGFWYLDEVGINANSSVRLQGFHPEMVDEGSADWFFHGVSSWNLDNNVSRSPQEPRIEGGLEPARSVIFCQNIEDRAPRQHHLGTLEMIRNAARAAGGGIVYVKPHPAQGVEGRARIAELGASDPNIRISDASVHDLIAASDWVISQNSAAGFEALMQRKRVITCGVSDYHHATFEVRSEDALRELLRSDAHRLEDWQIMRYFTWFLSKTCLEPQADDFAERAWARIKVKCMI